MKNDYLEKVIFELEKDTQFVNCRDFYKTLVKKYQIKNYWFYREVFVRIINYQIKTYGKSLSYVDEMRTKEEYKRRATAVYQMKRQRLGKKRNK